jgi:phospholipid/cholesterol/gamma-HCH transport system permease protein
MRARAGFPPAVEPLEATRGRAGARPVIVLRLFGAIGRLILVQLEHLGGVTLMLVQVPRALPSAPRYLSEIIHQMWSVGVSSMGLVTLTSLFVGAVTTVQARYQFTNLVPDLFLGTVVAKSVFIELGPVLTGLVVAGRVSASMAAELGTMRVTEQVDALETLAINPIEYLVAPRFIAAAVMLPMVTIFADLLAILGGLVVAITTLNVSLQIFVQGLRTFFEIEDVMSGLIKSLVFGIVIAHMGCFYGMRASGGAEGVGIATTRAVVAACVLILLTDYLMAEVLFRVVFA